MEAQSALAQPAGEVSSQTAYQAFQHACASISTQEAAQILNVPATTRMGGAGTAGSGEEVLLPSEYGNPYEYCLFVEPGHSRGAAQRGDAWLSIYVSSYAPLKADRDEPGTVAIPGVGVGVFGGPGCGDDIDITPAGESYVIALTLSLADDRGDCLDPAHREAAAKAAKVALKN